MTRFLSLTMGVATCVLAGAFAAPASASTTINFDDLANGAVVSHQYTGVTFSSDAGEILLTTAQSPPFNTSSPNFICTGTADGIDCTHDVFVAFAGPVNNLSFLFTGADNLGSTFNVDIFENSAFFGSELVVNSHALHDSQLVDLGAYSNITRIGITQLTDPAGLGFDDFKFDVGGSGAPEPSTWALVIAGFGLAGAQLRRRRQARA